MLRNLQSDLLFKTTMLFVLVKNIVRAIFGNLDMYKA